VNARVGHDRFVSGSPATGPCPVPGAAVPHVESVRRPPAAALRGLVAGYSGYRQAGLDPARHRGLPSGCLTLIVTLDEPLSIARHPDPRTAPGEYGTLVGGLHTSPALITHDGRQSGIQVGLKPLGARALLGLPAGELANIDVEGGDILGPVARELHERVRAASTWPERFAVLDDVLLRSIRRQAEPVDGEVAVAWRRLTETGGNAVISDLAAETGWSSRHLASRFHSEVGLTPKAAARVIRFDRARRMLQRQFGERPRHAHARRADGAGPAAGAVAAAAGELTFADVAAVCGYYDQAHMAREFGVLAGCPPSRWLAEEFRNVQAMAAGGAAGLRS
jgi:AraC-like DNA-binding protein